MIGQYVCVACIQGGNLNDDEDDMYLPPDHYSSALAINGDESDHANMLPPK